MQFITSGTLENIILNINSLEDDEMTLFVERAPIWQPASTCNVYYFDLDEMNHPLKINDAFYFLEVYLVKEIIEIWEDWAPVEQHNLVNSVQAVIYYAEYDAYKPVKKD